jgi:hypothetical protein
LAPTAPLRKFSKARQETEDIDAVAQTVDISASVETENTDAVVETVDMNALVETVNLELE